MTKLMISFGLNIQPVAHSMIEETVGENVQVICIPAPTTNHNRLVDHVQEWVIDAEKAARGRRIDLIWLPDLGAISALILPGLARQLGEDEPDLPHVVVLRRGECALELHEIIPGAMFRTW